MHHNFGNNFGNNSNCIEKLFFSFQGSDDVNSQFMTKFIPENETVAVLAPASPIEIILPASYNIQILDFALKKKLRKCDPIINRITPCVMKIYDQLYGNDFNQIVKKYMNLTDAIFSGIEQLEKLTGCQEPCNRVEYHITNYIEYHKSTANDDTTKIMSEIGQNTSSVIIISHLQKRAVQKVEENLKYTVISFISDAGGILGIFLGFSFWSIHSTMISPLLKKVFKTSSSDTNNEPPNLETV